jgi:hypothetical protein
MPNPIHSILCIENYTTTFQTANQFFHLLDENLHDILHTESSKKYGIAYRPPRSLSSFIAGFKSSATKKINELRNSLRQPVWQDRFHDDIIRNENEYRRIYQYIEDNPKNWMKDRMNQIL